jgi:hypothetical protein
MKKAEIIHGDIGQFTRLNVPGNGNCFLEALAALLRIDGINGFYLRALAVAELRSRRRIGYRSPNGTIFSV